MPLKRTISTTGLLFSAVGGIVGSGWLLGPYFAAQIAGPAATVAWVIGGILMMLIALTYAELSSMLPVTGGTLRFLHFSHGTLASFTIGWVAWLASAAVAPIETMALIHYATNYLPQLMSVKAGQHVLSGLGVTVSALLMLVMCFVNVMGARVLSKTNTFVVFLKLLVPALTIIVLFLLSYHSENFTSHHFSPYGIKGILTALPAAGIIFSFIGYSPAIQLAGEAKNPQKAIPFAILGALILCIVLYTLSQIVFIGALPASSIAHGWNHLSFTGDAGPFAGLALVLGAIWLSKILFLNAMISPFGTALIYTGSTARMTYAMGDNGYLPKWLMKLNYFNAPTRIIALNFVIGLLLFLPFPTWQSMMSFLVSALVLAYTVGPLALCVLRKKLPDRNRPFAIKAPYLTTLLSFYICNLIIFWTGWHIVSKMLITVVIGYVLLLCYLCTKEGRKLDLQLFGGWWLVPYLVLMGIVSVLGSFGGGHNVIHFGWDFLAVGIVTIVIYYCSKHAGCKTNTHHHINI